MWLLQHWSSFGEPPSHLALPCSFSDETICGQPVNSTNLTAVELSLVFRLGTSQESLVGRFMASAKADPNAPWLFASGGRAIAVFATRAGFGFSAS